MVPRIDVHGAIVGGDDIEAQARRVRQNLEAALAAAGCTWADVVRVSVVTKVGGDVRKAFGVFEPALRERKAPPLVSAFEVALEAVQPGWAPSPVAPEAGASPAR